MTPKHFPRISAVVFASSLIAASCGSSQTADSAAADSVVDDSAVVDVLDDDNVEIVEVSADVAADLAQVEGENQESHFDVDHITYDESDVIDISLDGDTASSGSGDVSIDGSAIVISAEGFYALSGTLSDGNVIVDAPESADVTLILDGVDITNTDGAAIAFMSADESTIVLAAGSTNTVTDGASYSFPDADTDEPNAAIYASTDLTIAGDGELVVNANYNDGITSKDGLDIEAGVITVTAVDDGIRGRDYVIVNGGSVTVDAIGDAVKADNDEDEDRGYIQISSGELTLTAGDDGLAAATDVIISGGELAIDAGSASDAGRGIVGDVQILIAGGTIDIESLDDAIHSNDNVTIDAGTLTLSAADDGIHADYSLTINGGDITITESFEGIESEVVTINGGNIDLTANDDGINVADADSEAVIGNGGRGQRGGDEGVGEHYVYINGGTTVITITGALDEQGDGIDANGFVEMTGGTVVVSGPTDTRNSAVDYSGGGFEISGGLFIGTHIDGRNSEDIDGGSQASTYITTGATVSAGTLVHIEDADGDSLVTFQPVNDYNVIVFSSPELVAGESYEVFLGGSVSSDDVSGLIADSAYTPGDLAGTIQAV